MFPYHKNNPQEILRESNLNLFHCSKSNPTQSFCRLWSTSVFHWANWSKLLHCSAFGWNVFLAQSNHNKSLLGKLYKRKFHARFYNFYADLGSLSAQIRFQEVYKSWLLLRCLSIKSNDFHWGKVKKRFDCTSAKFFSNHRCW